MELCTVYPKYIWWALVYVALGSVIGDAIIPFSFKLSKIIKPVFQKQSELQLHNELHNEVDELHTISDVSDKSREQTLYHGLYTISGGLDKTRTQLFHLVGDSDIVKATNMFDVRYALAKLVPGTAPETIAANATYGFGKQFNPFDLEQVSLTDEDLISMYWDNTDPFSIFFIIEEKIEVQLVKINHTLNISAPDLVNSLVFNSINDLKLINRLKKSCNIDSLAIDFFGDAKVKESFVNNFVSAVSLIKNLAVRRENCHKKFHFRRFWDKEHKKHPTFLKAILYDTYKAIENKTDLLGHLTIRRLLMITYLQAVLAKNLKSEKLTFNEEGLKGMSYYSLCRKTLDHSFLPIEMYLESTSDNENYRIPATQLTKAIHLDVGEEEVNATVVIASRIAHSTGVHLLENIFQTIVKKISDFLPGVKNMSTRITTKDFAILKNEIQSTLGSYTMFQYLSKLLQQVQTGRDLKLFALATMMLSEPGLDVMSILQSFYDENGTLKKKGATVFDTYWAILDADKAEMSKRALAVFDKPEISDAGKLSMIKFYTIDKSKATVLFVDKDEPTNLKSWLCSLQVWAIIIGEQLGIDVATGRSKEQADYETNTFRLFYSSNRMLTGTIVWLATATMTDILMKLFNEEPVSPGYFPAIES